MSALIDLTVKSSALLAAGTLLVLFMRRASASSRHLVWAGVLCAIALLPVSRLSLPALNVAVLASNISPVSAPPLLPPTPQQRTVTATKLAPIETFTALTPSAPPPGNEAFSFSLADFAVAVWWLGIAALVVRAVAGQVVLRRLTSRAAVVSDPHVLATLEEAASAFGVRRSISLLSHSDDGLPCTFGVVRPVILLPTSLLEADSEAGSRLRAVLVHETAHVARLDAISERITQVAVMMFWFNPLVWFAARQVRFERERAADDAVLAGGAKASDYASDLLAIARTQSRPLWSSAVPMAVSALERRVRAILDDGVRRGRHSRVSLVMSSIVLAAMLPVSAVRLVARSAPLPAAPLSAEASGPAPLAADVAPPSSTVEQSDPLAVWNTERERNLRQVLRRGRAAHDEALTKVAIGTLAPTDVAVLETTVAQLEAAVKNFTLSTTPLTPKDLKSRRGVLAAAFSRLESSERRFTNGSLTTTDLASALMTAANVIEPSIQVPVARSAGQMSSLFTLPPKGTPARPTSPKGYSFLAPAAQVAPASQKADQADPLAAWNAERLANLRQVLDRARAAHHDQLVRVEIGTSAAVDVVTLETTLAKLELSVRDFKPSSTLPSAGQIEGVRTAFATALRNLDAAEVRFNNGLLTTGELATALMRAAAPLDDPAASMFTSANFPGSTTKDLNSAQALYELLTGRVQTIARELTDAELLAALKNAVNIASEDNRAQGLVMLAQRYAFTPEMAAAYVAAANSITAVSVRDRVFAQPVRLKSSGKNPGYYFQR